jgi:hypothetical protein
LSFWLDECAMIGHRFSKRKKLLHFTWILGQDARPGNRYAKQIAYKENRLLRCLIFLQERFMRIMACRPKYVITNGIDPAMYPPQKKQGISISLALAH